MDGSKWFLGQKIRRIDRSPFGVDCDKVDDDDDALRLSGGVGCLYGPPDCWGTVGHGHWSSLGTAL
jgi:hypothetical protein